MSEQRLAGPEAVALVRFAKGCFPAMQVDEYTPDAWTELLGPFRFEDCKEALVNLGRRLPFAAASDICAEVKRMRNARLSDFGLLPEPPSGLTPAEYQRWEWETTRAIADGVLVRPRPTPSIVHQDVDYTELMPRVPEDNA